jgi:hypothetical protein
VALLFAALFCGIGYRAGLLEHSLQVFVLIALTPLAMGTRNTAVRKLAIPDLTITVLTLTITGIGADSSLANGNNPRLARRVAAVAAMFLGATLGAVVIHYSISPALWLATAISAVCGVALFRLSRLVAWMLELGVLGFDLSIDGKVGVNVFPNAKEFFVRFAGGHVVAHQSLCSTELKTCQWTGSLPPAQTGINHDCARIRAK